MIDYCRVISNKIMAKVSDFPYLSHWIIFFADLVITSISFTFTCLVCSSLVGHTGIWDFFWGKLSAIILVSAFFFLLFKTHKGIIRYSNYHDAMRIFIALLFANIVVIVINKLYSNYIHHSFLSRISMVVNFQMTFGLIFFFRMAVRLVFDMSFMSTKNKKSQVLVYGIETTEISIATMINSNLNLPYRIVGFISPSDAVEGQHIVNQPVYSRKDFFENYANFKNIRAVLIDPKTVERMEKRLLAEICVARKMELLTVPSPEEWTQGENGDRIKNIRIDDLLRRKPITINSESISNNIRGKTVMVTGAAGSIGSEIVRQLCNFNPKLLILCDIAESPLHDLTMEISDNYPTILQMPIILDVRNFNKTEAVFEKFRPQYIYHAAAYKHVPLMEVHPEEAVETNVLGTKNVADLASEYGAECFVMISTDKAVNPSSVMGASKRIAEIYVRILSEKNAKNSGKAQTRFITTRFGNVLGSNGSVVPRFAEQIRRGGPVTVTDPDIFRYFMTIPEACSLVLEAGNFGKSGEIYVFDMGESVKIINLAEDMIRLSGYEPYHDIDIVFTGLRPGEKLYEELLYREEACESGIHEKILVGKCKEANHENILKLLDELIATLPYSSRESIVKKMKEIVPEFISKNSVYCALDLKTETV